MSQRGYARLSNDLWRSPAAMKMLTVKPEALAYYVAAISYASDNLTDGTLEETVVRYVLRVPDDVIAFLVEEGKWEPVEGGWTIHNYGKWQNSREQIEATRAKDRARKTRKTTTQTESEQNPDGNHTETDVNPTTSFNQNQNQNQNTSSNEEEEETRASAPTTPAESQQAEARIIDLWEPDASAQATADEKAREGYPCVDLAALATRFRRKLHARGLAAYKLLPTRQSLSAEFCTWVEKEAEYMAERTKGTPTPPTHVAAPHEHTWTCEHVQDLIAPHEAEYDHTRDGFAPSAWMQACSRLATHLNDGQEPQAALADILQMTRV